MPLSNIWALTAGVTQTCAAWGISNLTRRREFGTRCGEVRFTVHQDADRALPFAFKEAVTISRAGVPWFVGLVTKTPRMASPSAEYLQYVISDPWWYLEQTTFQQQWAQISGSGGATTLTSTTKSRCNLGQANVSGGLSLNLGQVMREVLYYALYAAQGIAFPSTVDASGLPIAPSMTAGPFQIGTISPSITEPFFEVRDLTCAEIMQKLLRYLPDTGKWFDFTTSPPTLNIDTRANLAAKTISVFGGTLTSKFDPTARYDLQVPCVICKYEATSTIDGQTRSNLIVDKYPAGVPDNAVGAFVRTVDLIGGTAVYQKQNVVVGDAPRTEADSIASNWVQKNPLLFWLFGSVLYPSTIWDTGGITLQSIVTSLNPTDPNNTTPEAGFSLNALTEQLLAGAITQWMIDNGDCIAAKVIKRVVLAYSGSEPHTKNLFNFNPSAPNTLSIDLGCVCTNASTRVYEELTSATAAEPVPVGNAQALYNILAALHQQGSIELSEDECSDLLRPGCIFNTTDGLPEWQAMNALILGVTENVDKGKTSVEFGPTLYLGLQELTELARANRGRLFATAATERTSGQAGGDHPVVGHAYSPEKHVLDRTRRRGGQHQSLGADDRQYGRSGVDPGLHAEDRTGAADAAEWPKKHPCGQQP